MHLGQIAEEIQHRLQHLFTCENDSRHFINDGNDIFNFNPHGKDYLSFYEFFDADTDRVLGASHQCGSNRLIAKIVHNTGHAFILFQSALLRGVKSHRIAKFSWLL